MLTCAEGSTDELKVYIHTPAFARPQCQTSSPKPLDQSNPNFVWNHHGHGATGGGGGGAKQCSLHLGRMTVKVVGRPHAHIW